MAPRRLRVLARLAYLAIVLLATLTDLHFSPDRSAAGDRAIRALAEPLTWSDVIDGVRNVVLFGGLGAVWVATALSARLRRPVLVVTLFGFALSVTIEAIQTFSPVRVASLMDVLTDTFGTFAGGVGMALFILAARRARGAKTVFGVPAFLLAAPYGMAVICEALTPLFRTDLVPGVSGGPVERWHSALEAARPLSFFEIPFFDVVLFIPAGFLAVMLLAERRRETSRRWPLVALVAAPILAGAHLAHGAWGLPIRWEAVSADILAFGFGSWAAHRWMAAMEEALRGAARVRATIVAYAALLVLWGWRPLFPEAGLGAIARKVTMAGLVPLRLLAASPSVFSAVHVSQQFLLYLPLGVLLGAWPLRSRGRWLRVWPAAFFAVAIECGHLIIRGRTFDVTNPMLACAGLGVGWLVVQRADVAEQSQEQARSP